MACTACGLEVLHDSGDDLLGIPAKPAMGYRVRIGNPAHALPPALTSRLSDALQPGETVVWIGRPERWTYAKQGFAVCLKVWGFWLLFVLGSSAWRSSSQAEFVASLNDLAVLVGLLGLAWPLWMWRKAGSLAYAITDRRTLEVDGDPWGRISTYAPDDLALGVERIDRGNGFGDLIMGHVDEFETFDDKGRSLCRFIAIRDVHRVEALVRALVKAHSMPSGIGKP